MPFCVVVHEYNALGAYARDKAHAFAIRGRKQTGNFVFLTEKDGKLLSPPVRAQFKSRREAIALAEACHWPNQHGEVRVCYGEPNCTVDTDSLVSCRDSAPR